MGLPGILGACKAEYPATPSTMHTDLKPTLSRPKHEWAAGFWAIRNPQDVAELLEVPFGHLTYIIYRAPHKYPYRIFSVPKRSGGARQIAAPHATLKILQEKLNGVLKEVYRPKNSTHGFVDGRSIVTNARPHCGKNFVLNVDLEGFFNAIHFGRVRGMFMAPPYNIPPSAAAVLAQLVCHNKVLPQGAPTSPIISNMVCARLDGELQRLAKRHRCLYTRYADDITFSSSQRDFPNALASISHANGKRQTGIGPELASAIASNGFSINLKKARLRSKTERQFVTGLVVNRVPNTHRKTISQLRSMLHSWRKKGLEAAAIEFAEIWDRRARRSSSPAPLFQKVVKGRLDFVGMVKSQESRRYRILRNELSALVPQLITALPVPTAYANNHWATWFEHYRQLVFQLEVKTPSGTTAGGTVFAWKNEWLATAAHNLGNDVRVYASGNQADATAVAHAIPHPNANGGHGVDAALVKLPAGTLNFTRGIPLRTKPITPGEEVAALGFPNIPFHNSSLSIMAGKVESLATTYNGSHETIQVSIDFSGGVSGGPVIDRDGNLVGIVIEATTENAGAEVPGKKFRNVLPASYLNNIPTT